MKVISALLSLWCRLESRNSEEKERRKTSPEIHQQEKPDTLLDVIKKVVKKAMTLYYKNKALTQQETHKKKY